MTQKKQMYLYMDVKVKSFNYLNYQMELLKF